MNKTKIKSIISLVMCLIVVISLSVCFTACKKKTDTTVSASGDSNAILKDDNYVDDPFSDEVDSGSKTTAASGSGATTTKKSANSSGSANGTTAKTTTKKSQNTTTTKKSSNTTTKANANAENTDENGGKWTGYY